MARKKRPPTPEALPPVVRALGLIQPGATMLTRGYSPDLIMAYGVSYRGPLYIYAALCWNEMIRGLCNKYKYITHKELGYSKKKPLPVGCVVGRADLVSCDPIPEGYSDLDEDITDILAYKIFHEKSAYGFRYVWKFENICYFEYKDRVRIEETSPALFRIEPVDDSALKPAAPPWTIPAVDLGSEQMEFAREYR